MMVHELLQDIPVILASQSPRRVALLSQLGITFQQIASQFAERYNGMKPKDFVIYNAEKKAATVHAQHHDSLVIGADTIVEIDNQILGKPTSVAQATAMLSQLSAKTHQVHTGISIFYKTKKLTNISTTTVTFFSLSPETINRYIATKEPMDKAGAYGIQGLGSQFIRSIKGCYFNVMGFPISCFSEMVNALFD